MPSSSIFNPLQGSCLLKTIVLLSSIVLLAACSSNSGNNNSDDMQVGAGSSNSRILYDAPVNGVTYRCDGNTALTSEGGKFSCINAPVVFSLGDLVLGQIDDFNSDNFVYLQDLVGVAREAFDNERVVKIARLLLSLDDDGIVADEIDIPSSAGASFFAGETLEDDLQQLVNRAGGDLVSTAFALSHLRRSLNGGGNASDYKVQVIVNDIDTTQFGIANPVTLRLRGAELVDEKGAAVNSIKLEEPLKLARLYLRNPPETDQDIKITVQAEGYMDSGSSILLYTDETDYLLNLKLVKKAEGQIAAGIHNAQQDLDGLVSEAGEILEEVITESKASSLAPGVKVVIPKGTVMTDAAGNPVKGASLKTTNN